MSLLFTWVFSSASLLLVELVTHILNLWSIIYVYAHIIFFYIICIYTHTWIHKYIHSYALVHIMLCIICDVYKVFFLICMLLNSKQDNLRAEYFGILYTREKYIHTYMQNIFLLQSCNIFHIHLALTFCVFLKILKRLE